MTNAPIPPLDLPAGNLFAVSVPDSFILPQENPFGPDLDELTIALLIAAFNALAGINPSAATMLTNAQNYSCLTQDQQLPGLIYKLNSILVAIRGATNVAGLVYTGNWSNNTPTVTPSSSAAIGIDSGTLRQWQWVNGVWS